MSPKTRPRRRRERRAAGSGDSSGKPSGGSARGGPGVRVVAQNRKARHRYHFVESVEAGIALTGNEVKSLRQGGMSIGEGYAKVRDGEAFLVDCHVAPYEKTGFDTPEPARERKLLLSRGEIRRIALRVRERGYTLVPVRVYFKGRWAKVEIALARGKSFSDKRASMKKRDQKRHMARAKAARGRAAARKRRRS